MDVRSGLSLAPSVSTLPCVTARSWPFDMTKWISNHSESISRKPRSGGASSQSLRRLPVCWSVSVRWRAIGKAGSSCRGAIEEASLYEYVEAAPQGCEAPSASAEGDPHVMRHPAITRLVEAGLDLPIIRKISGHKRSQWCCGMCTSTAPTATTPLQQSTARFLTRLHQAAHTDRAGRLHRGYAAHKNGSDPIGTDGGT